jgi:hypothetical protein
LGKISYISHNHQEIETIHIKSRTKATKAIWIPYKSTGTSRNLTAH